MAVKDGLPATDFSRQNREWVKAVAGGGSGGGGGLPEITAADEGKVLTVESGAAAWATAGGGECGLFAMVASEIPDDPFENVILDKTFSEIVEAINNKKLPVIFWLMDERDLTITFIKEANMYYDNDEYFILDSNDNELKATSINDYPTSDYEI